MKKSAYSNAYEERAIYLLGDKSKSYSNDRGKECPKRANDRIGSATGLTSCVTGTVGTAYSTLCTTRNACYNEQRDDYYGGNAKRNYFAF